MKFLLIGAGGRKHAIVRALASAGYSQSSSKGNPIEGLAEAAEIADVTHAGHR